HAAHADVHVAVLPWISSGRTASFGRRSRGLLPRRQPEPSTPNPAPRPYRSRTALVVISVPKVVKDYVGALDDRATGPSATWPTFPPSSGSCLRRGLVPIPKWGQAPRRLGASPHFGMGT